MPDPFGPPRGSGMMNPGQGGGVAGVAHQSHMNLEHFAKPRYQQPGLAGAFNSLFGVKPRLPPGTPKYNPNRIVGGLTKSAAEEGVSLGARIVGEGVEAGGRTLLNSGVFSSKAPRKPRRKPFASINPTTTAFMKGADQEQAMQVSAKDVLAKRFTEAAEAERPAFLAKVTHLSADLRKFTPALAELDAEERAQVLAAWIEAGDADIKEALIADLLDAQADERAEAEAEQDDEDELTDEEMEEVVAEKAEAMGDLQKMIADAPDQLAANRVLVKVAQYRQDIAAHPELLTEAGFEAWAASGDGDMKKAVARATIYGGAQDAGRGRKGKKQGTAASGTAAKLGSHGPDSGAAPRPAMGQPSSTKAAGGGVQDRVGGKQSAATQGVWDVKRATTTGSGTGDAADRPVGNVNSAAGVPETYGKADLAQDLLKCAPDAMVVELSKLAPEEQVGASLQAADYAADLMAFSDMVAGAGGLAKGDLDTVVDDWMREGDAVLKSWTAEALAGAEAIPLELGKSVQAWEAGLAGRPFRTEGEGALGKGFVEEAAKKVIMTSAKGGMYAGAKIGEKIGRMAGARVASRKMKAAFGKDLPHGADDVKRQFAAHAAGIGGRHGQKYGALVGGAAPVGALATGGYLASREQERRQTAKKNSGR